MSVDEQQLLGSRIGMSDIESYYSRSPRAFDVESASEGLIVPSLRRPREEKCQRCPPIRGALRVWK
ncbi:unnamed protein product [Prunus armeniaca]